MGLYGERESRSDAFVDEESDSGCDDGWVEC